MYSQNKEEGVINSLFGDRGRFLDVGAFDGKTFSNTLRLYERGWSGVLIEPSPLAFAGLKKQYAGSERVELVNAAITKEDGQIKFYESCGDAVSSTELAHKEKWEKGYGSKFTEVTVQGLSWMSIFNKYGNDFNFVNLDTESTNLELLKCFPLAECPAPCMCIEHDSKIGDMMDILIPYGYRVVYQSGENIVVWNGPA